MESRNWKSNPFLKLLCLVLTISSICIGICSAGIKMYAYDQKILPSTEFADTSYVKYEMNESSMHMMYLIRDAKDDLEDMHIPYQDLDYTVSVWNKKKQVFEEVLSTYDETTIYINQKTDVYGVRNDDEVYTAVEPYNEGEYEITVYAKEALLKRSHLVNQHVLFEMVKKYESIAIYGIIGSVIVLLFALSLAFTLAGHHRDSENVRGTWFEKIPYDVLIILTITLCAIPISMLEECGYVDIYPYFIVWAGTGFCMILLVLYIFLMSTAVRIKTNTLWKNTVIYSVCHGVFRFIREVSWIYAGVLGILLVILLIETNGIHSDYGFDAAFFYYLTDFVLILGFAYAVYAGKMIVSAAKHLAEGDSSYRIADTDMKKLIGPFKNAAEHINSLGNGIEIAVNKQMKSERLKSELIANVSHDIRTPLTSIISYTDLLQKEHTEAEGKQYLEVLARQSARLKKLTEDVLEASKASTGNINMELGEVDIKELIMQSIGEYQDRYEQAGLEVVTTFEDLPLLAYVDGRLLWRALRNVFSNAGKYSLEHTRVYVEARKNDSQNIQILIRNISKEQLNISADELMERFVRGDSSRHTEGSGLGLNIARSLIEMMHGTFDVYIEGDLFRVSIVLPVK